MAVVVAYADDNTLCACVVPALNNCNIILLKFLLLLLFTRNECKEIVQE